MTLFVLSILAVAVAAVIGVVMLRRRNDAYRRTQRSLAVALGTDETDVDLLAAAREAVGVAAESRKLANGYAAALQGASVGIAILNDAGAVEYANPAAHMVMDGDGERAVLRTRVTALGQRVCAKGVQETIEVDIHDPDRRVLSLTAVPLTASSDAFGAVVLYVEDLSAKRRIDAMRTDFVANASHELKTPLGALALLAETLADTEDEEMRMRLGRRLQSEANRMANVIDDVLHLAETESLGAEYTHVSIADVITTSVASISELAAEQEITILPDDVADATVAADEDQLVSAVTNLLQNAITYTAVKGEPGIVRYRSTIEDAMVTIEVEDTGIGIPTRYTDRVFERFFRVDRARSRESGGTGLGLSIVRNVAKAHGGSVSVKSKVGVGSTFSISLPVVEETH